MEKREIKFERYSEFPKYEVGSDGTIFSLDYNHTGNRQEIKQHPDQDGYLYVILVVNKRRYKRSVHRMVAKTFIQNPNTLPQVNHKNGIRHDNHIENLEWCTAQENCIHSFRVNGRVASDKLKQASKERFSGRNNPKAKLNEAQVLSIIRLRSKGESLKSIAERHGISVSQVSSIARGKSWS